MNCTLCPRKCPIDRKTGHGFCKADTLPTVARVMLHKWEEPCICYGGGSGAVFFSGCQLQCVFCQNHMISGEICGEVCDSDTLCHIFLQLQEKGACNINLVSPTPHLNEVIPALEKAKSIGLSIPVVFNSGGYEAEETIRHLAGLIDIYMPDFKFIQSETSYQYAYARDYPEIAERAIKVMQKQTGKPMWEDGKMLSGTLVRHLVLPGHSEESALIVEKLANIFSGDGIVLSLMRQYTPMHRASEFPSLFRRVTSLEYGKAVRMAEEKGFEYLYTQEKESATKDFVPDFSNSCADFS